MRNERWKSIRHARPDRVSLDFSGDEVATIPLSSIVFVYSPSAHIPVVCKVMMQQNTCILIYHNRSHERQRRSMLGSVMGVRAPPRTLALRICRLSSIVSRLSSKISIFTLGI